MILLISSAGKIKIHIMRLKLQITKSIKTM